MQKCDSHEHGCNCGCRPSAVQQSLAEVDFMRSACAAAKAGDCDRLAQILFRRPDSIHDDGVSGQGFCSKLLIIRTWNLSTGNSGYTPLHYASRAGRLNAVVLLLRRGCTVAVGDASDLLFRS